MHVGPATAGGRGRAARQTERAVAGLFRDEGAHGAAVVRDVASGEVVAAFGAGRDVDAPVMPLSVIKLYLAALWWDEGRGDGNFQDPRAGRVTVRDMLERGYDRPGIDMAVELRREVGSQRMLARLRRYGLGARPGHLALGSRDDDAAWGQTLSIGEERVTVTLRQVSSFLRAVGAGGARVVAPDTALRMQRAMRGAVERGTARSAAPILRGSRWHLGGKTGTGPDKVGPTSDGWFAGLAFEGDRPRYAIAIFVEHRGPGGAVAASIAARLTRALAAERP
ncbi:MAG TPA: penicillin-binding transpeptidase domain-containing protein [Kofleriaceae bacterium]|nr:penicillin-binding transpeptidase domain-containing protein [Kofleriaceae bacterium]